jgi:hypothetical protein
MIVHRHDSLVRLVFRGIRLWLLLAVLAILAITAMTANIRVWPSDRSLETGQRVALVHPPQENCAGSQVPC